MIKHTLSPCAAVSRSAGASGFMHRLVITLVALALSGTAVTQTAAASVPKRPPVASDCSVDVTDAFNSWLATIPNGSTISLAPRGCYLSNGSILFRDKRNITIRGNGAIIKASGEPACPQGSARNALGYCVVPKNPNGSCPVGTREFSAADCAALMVRAQLWFDRGGGIVVRDLTVQGSNFTPDCATPTFSCNDSIRESQPNIIVAGSDGVLIDRVHFRNAWGDGLQTGSGGIWDADGTGALMARYVTVQNSTVNTVGRHAFSCNDCRNFVVKDNKITNVGYWGFDIEVEARTWHGDVKLLRNRFSNLRIGIMAVTSHEPPSTLGPIVARDNIRTDRAVSCNYDILVQGLYGVSPPSVSVTGNRVGGGAGGIYMYGVTKADVIGNTVEIVPNSALACPSKKAVVFDRVSSGSIVANTVLNAADADAENVLFHLFAGSTAKVCGNRTSATGAFDQPRRCTRADLRP